MPNYTKKVGNFCEISDQKHKDMKHLFDFVNTISRSLSKFSHDAIF